MLGVEDAQRAQILDGALQYCREVPVGGAHLRGALPPFPQPARGNGVFDGLAARVAQRHRDPAGDRHHFYACRPLAAGGDRHIPLKDAAGDRGAAIAADEQPALRFTPAAAQPQRRVFGARAGGGPRRYPAVLDLEQVGEVGVGGERHDARGRQQRDVLEGDVLAHAVADVTAPHHQQRAVREPWRRRHLAQERGGIRFGLLDRQRLRRTAVHEEFPARQHAGVPDEQPLGMPGPDVTSRFADAKCGTFNQCHVATRECPAY